MMDLVIPGFTVRFSVTAEQTVDAGGCFRDMANQFSVTVTAQFVNCALALLNEIQNLPVQLVDHAAVVRRCI